MLNILFIATNHNPFSPQKTGAVQRTSLLLDACLAIGHVDVVVFGEGITSDRENCDVVYCKNRWLMPEGNRYAKAKRFLSPWRIESFFPIRKEIGTDIDAIIERKSYDCIVVRYLPNASACGLMKYADRLVVDVDDNPSDVELALAQQGKSFRAKMYHYVAALLLRLATHRALQKIRFSFFPNAEQVYKHNSAYLPNVPYYEQETLPPAESNHQVMFVGDLRYKPNYLGIEHFVANIWPKVVAQVPDAKLKLIGKFIYGWNDRLLANCMSQSLISNSISILGFVENLVDEYKTAQVCVVPVFSGAGTNIKVLEALQMGRSCVTTKTATRGFDKTLTIGVDYLMADNDKQFVDNVVKLLLDLGYNHSIAHHGSESVRKHYSKSEFKDIVKRSLV